MGHIIVTIDTYKSGSKVFELFYVKNYSNRRKNYLILYGYFEEWTPVSIVYCLYSHIGIIFVINF